MGCSASLGLAVFLAPSWPNIGDALAAQKASYGSFEESLCCFLSIQLLKLIHWSLQVSVNRRRHGILRIVDLGHFVNLRHTFSDEAEVCCATEPDDGGGFTPDIVIQNGA